MDEHLGYEKHAKSVVKNSRNGMTSKHIKNIKPSTLQIENLTL
jgi:hypothetical protein